MTTFGHVDLAVSLEFILVIHCYSIFCTIFLQTFTFYTFNQHHKKRLKGIQELGSMTPGAVGSIDSKPLDTANKMVSVQPEAVGALKKKWFKKSAKL